MTLPELRNNKYKSFHSRLAIGDEGYFLSINGFDVSYPKTNPVPGRQEKRPYFSDNSGLYEPGLISWLLALEDYFNGQRIRFVDVGAANGYFTFFTSALFVTSQVLAVEGNPVLAKFIQEASKNMGIENIAVENAFVGKTSMSHEFLIYGYDFFDKNKITARRLEVESRNILRWLANKIIGRDAYTVRYPITANINEKQLSSFLDQHDDVINIFKIDAEGSQANFLPDSSASLIDANAILLMEFDSLKKISRYKTTNGKLCVPFLDAGYALYWGNHRLPNTEFKEIKHLTKELETNSMGVLIPKRFQT